MSHRTMIGAVLVLAGGTAHAGLVDPALDTVLRQTAPDETVAALVYLVDQVDVANLDRDLATGRATLADRHTVVVETLQDMATHGQRGLVAHLEDLARTGQVRDFEAYWIVNAIRVEAAPDQIRRLAERPDVDRVYYDHEIELVTPVLEPEGAAGGGNTDGGGPEIGVEAVRAPEVWEMGYTGEGVLVATLDTGVDGNHPALASRWRGAADPRYASNPEWAWFDPVSSTDFPRAFGAHGTHTMGTVCGGAPGDQVGVAPGAQWIHAAVIDRVSIARTISDSILAFQWMLDPDGDAQTNWDVPDVCSNSWGIADFHGVPDCDETFWSFLDACEAAGIVILFSAGNEGSGGLRRPSDRATDDYRTAAVAAVDARNPAWPIASFSSRGPTNCTTTGDPAIKPDISAPGVSVRSAFPGGSYGSLSGTSMASPHINGVVALMRQANPNIGVTEIKQIIFETAADLGPAGEDNDYGWGMVDAVESVLAALGSGIEGDVNGDGVVDFADVVGVLAAWGPCEGCPEDVNGDDVVDTEDILLVIANWSE